MNNLVKEEIAAKLSGYCSRYESQNKAAKSLKGVSAATISHILSKKWDLIKDELWRNLATQINYEKTEWVTVETRDYQLLTTLLVDAKENSNVFAVTGEAGTGKSLTLRLFTEANKRVYLLRCDDFWNRRMFLQELLTAMGRDYSGYTVGEMMHEVVRTLKMQEKPLIIMDEADKLSDQVLYFFITLYNSLEDNCGIVMCATDHLAKRIMRGLKLNKKGYKEIYSRLGRRFIELKGLSSGDIAAVCMANGITDKIKIRDIIDDCEYDLRRIKRKIHALKEMVKRDINTVENEN